MVAELKGRWPGTFILQHSVECKRLDTIVPECAPDCPIGGLGPLAERFNQIPMDDWVYCPKPSGVERHGGTKDLVPPEGAVKPNIRWPQEWKASAEAHEGDAGYNWHACLLPGERVLTNEGPKPIETLVEGNLVYSETGTFEKVIGIIKHECDGPVYEIRVAGVVFPTTATGNHPFLVSRCERRFTSGGNLISRTTKFCVPDYVNADELKAGDYLLTPLPTFSTAPRQEEADEDFWLVAGLWLAEGSLISGRRMKSGKVHRYPAFSLNANETNLRNRIAGRFGAAHTKTYKHGENGILVVVFVAGLAERFAQLCGKLAAEKHIATEIFGLPMPLRQAFLEGYWTGDGHIIHESSRDRCDIVTVSEALAVQIQLLAESIGFRAGTQARKPKTSKLKDGRAIVGRHTIYTIGVGFRDRTKQPPSHPSRLLWNGQTFVVRRIKGITKITYRGPVWNLTMAGTHTFQTSVGMSHNSVKPLALMEHFVKLTTPPGGKVLDPFVGSGTAVIAALLNGFDSLGIDRDPDYIKLAKARLDHQTRTTTNTGNGVLECADSMTLLSKFPPCEFDSLVTDPPAGIALAGLEWDRDRGGRNEWTKWLAGIMKEVNRTLKPGAYGVVWAFGKTLHWTMDALEQGGFTIRSVIAVANGTGFPKGRDPTNEDPTLPAGLNTTLRPLTDYWVLVQKPISEPTVAANIKKWGVGALNIDATRTRVLAPERDDGSASLEDEF
jgi:hypothetical protein